MYLTTAITSAVLGSVSAQKASEIFVRDPLPPNVKLLESVVSFANQTLWIGYVKYKDYSEAYLPDVVQGGMSFTSYHQTPTGWQNPYVSDNETGPVEFTIPHSHYVPPGASTAGFNFDQNGTLTFRGRNRFVACQTTEDQVENNFYQIWWKGNKSTHGANCSAPLILAQYDNFFPESA